jgi:PKD repeat protein
VDSVATVYFSDLSASTSGWYWNFGDGNSSTDQNPVHSYSYEGTFTVCLTTSNGCGLDTLCIPVTVTIPVALSEPNSIKELSVVPNPFDHSTTVLFENTNNDIFQLSIYDLLGNKVRNQNQIRSDRAVVKKGNLSPGIYCIVLSSGKVTLWERIVIE